MRRVKLMKYLSHSFIHGIGCCHCRQGEIEPPSFALCHHFLRQSNRGFGFAGPCCIFYDNECGAVWDIKLINGLLHGAGRFYAKDRLQGG